MEYQCSQSQILTYCHNIHFSNIIIITLSLLCIHVIDASNNFFRVKIRQTVGALNFGGPSYCPDLAFCHLSAELLGDCGKAIAHCREVHPCRVVGQSKFKSIPFLRLNCWVVESASSSAAVVILVTFLGRKAERYSEQKLVFSSQDVQGSTGLY